MTQIVDNPYEQEPALAGAGANPYLGAHAAPAPDLDVGAPTLRNAEQQRVNRKALLFLAGIVGLLATMAVLVFHGVGKKDPSPKTAEEQVSIPTLADSGTPPLPQQASAAPAEPIDLRGNGDSAAYAPPLPPLPPESSDARSYPATAMPSAPRPPSLMERRMGMTETQGGDAASGQVNPYAQALAMQGLPGQAPGGASQAAADDASDAARRAGSARMLRHADALLVRGTMLRCILETRIISEADGFTSCILTEPVYSINGRSMLLARGSKVYGTYKARPKGNRIEVIWDRITTPGGVDVSMSSPGTDPLGSAGYPGMVDAHWAQRITSAVMVSLLSDLFKYEAAKHGPSTASISNGVVVVSPFESNTASTLDRIANQAADAAMSRPPTVTINQGTLVSVYVAKDVDFTEVLGR